MIYLDEGDNFDYSSKVMLDLVAKINRNVATSTPKEFAIAAYNYIRDNWAYYPYRFSLVQDDWRASHICRRREGHCLDKAILLITVLRGKGIPARLGLAKVINHIVVEDILKKLGNNVLVPHGYVELYLNNKWVKATPAFDIALCEKLGVEPLVFDGEKDSLFQAYNSDGSNKFMEYLEDYGTFDVVPLNFMRDLMRETYPVLKSVSFDLGKTFNFKN